MNQKVLVVDDDEGNRELFVSVLGYMDNVVGVAIDNPTCALKAFNKGGYDLILTDLEMHSDSEAGFKFIVEVRKINIKVPIIMITGKTDDEIRRLGIEYGANHVLYKPIKVEALIGVIQECLDAS